MRKIDTVTAGYAIAGTLVIIIVALCAVSALALALSA
ncbi:MAG: hypothetical protein QG616_659 [Pseudomonadota bacterium]|nr:hypothetical protein [Pseudomonadota bacterium]